APTAAKTVDGFKSSGHANNLSPKQVQQIKTVWQLTDSTTPRTSLKAPQSQSLNSEQARRIQTLWQGTLSGRSKSGGGRTRSGGSARSGDPRRSQRRSSLVIGSRALVDV